MHVRRLSSVLVTATALALLAASPAAAAAPFPTPTGGGCQANGQALATTASSQPAPGAFGQFVAGNAPIAPAVAAFFDDLCD